MRQKSGRIFDKILDKTAFSKGRQQVISIKFILRQLLRTEESWTMAIASCNSTQEKKQRN